jgi:hypothetical protein
LFVLLFDNVALAFIWLAQSSKRILHIIFCFNLENAHR